MNSTSCGRKATLFRLALLLASATGCAATLHGRRLLDPNSAAGYAWQDLQDGQTVAAELKISSVLVLDPSDPVALFAAANLAYERGDDVAALAHSVALLQSASRGQDRVAVALSTAMLSRVPRLLSEIPDRRAAEEQLVALAPEHLPWRAQYALALNVIDIARKRADGNLMARELLRAGCVPAMTFVGTGGRLPYLDLKEELFTPVKQPRSLLKAGCQFQLNDVDNRAGIRILRSEVELTQGRHDLVLDYAGPARLRVDRGPWHEHGGSLDVYGPRWSAQRIAVSAGKHVIEVRLGSYGAAVDVALLVVPAVDAEADADLGNAAEPAEAALADFSAALVANLTGDIDGLLTRIARLATRPRFALGLAAIARLGEADPTRPADILRDQSRVLWQRALAVDAHMARVWLDLANLEMQNDRPREAAENAGRARQEAPTWWPAHQAVAVALRAQGFEAPADTALSAGLALIGQGQGGCQMLERGFQRAEEREEQGVATHLIELLARCDAQNDNPRYWARKHGDLAKVEALLRRSLPTSEEPLWARGEIADVLLAQGNARAALKDLEALVDLAPRDARVRIRLADAQMAAGVPSKARATIAEALRLFPGRQDVRQVARLAGLPLPLDDFRLDGAAVVRDFLASGRKYQAPAVVVLDRAVERVFPDGTRLVLTHSITQVLSKDAIENVGEVQVPSGAEILVLRTRKADGSLREAEESAGKSSVSVPDLGVGDFVEAETLEVKEPREAFAPGFIGERFFFRSPEAPLDRSEYVLVAPRSMHLDVNRRAGATAPVETAGLDETRILRFVVHESPRILPERSSVTASEWVPSVRVSSGITLEDWSRFLADRLARVSRGSPEVRRVAADIARQSGSDRGRLPEAVVAWVREHIEPEGDIWEPATSTLARNRGNRAGLIIALARSLNVPADLVMARSLLFAEADAPISMQELDDFHDLLVRFRLHGGDRFVDPRLRRASFAYLVPGLDGAPAVVVGADRVVKVVAGVKDSRGVIVRARLAADGAATVAVTEQLSGWPAVEWTEMLDHAGKDKAKLRQEFEQRWLGQQFPGAQLGELSVETGDGSTGTRVSYTFKAARMADRQGGVLRLRPAFFQSQPGRRFGTEPERRTALMIGFDVPLDLDAEIELPPGSKVLELGQGVDVVSGGARFFEERRVSSVGESTVSITLHRLSHLPIMRVSPGDYQGFAAKLRAVDPIEQGEIRISVPGK